MRNELLAQSIQFNQDLKELSNNTKRMLCEPQITKERMDKYKCDIKRLQNTEHNPIEIELILASITDPMSC